MATLYSGVPSQMRFPFSSSHTHYTSNDDAAAQIRMQQFRYSNYRTQHGMEGLLPPPSPPSPSCVPALGGGAFGLPTKQQQTRLYPSTESSNHVFRLASPLFRSQNVSTSMYMQQQQSMIHKTYSTQQQQQHQQLLHSSSRTGDHLSDVLLVSPGVPTPVELSIYEIKQPTGFLHVTRGNQTVEFLDGVANMPQKR
uniref:Uncharacterized protein n=1 Tax=Peronospora matthiolae TaxID=2874970 RepID=A0AAV1VD47_9STRA